MGRTLRIKIPVVKVEYVEYVAQKSAQDAVITHEAGADPHPQYTTDAEVKALAPRFVTFWKWS